MSELGKILILPNYQEFKIVIGYLYLEILIS